LIINFVVILLFSLTKDTSSDYILKMVVNNALDHNYNKISAFMISLYNIYITIMKYIIYHITHPFKQRCCAVCVIPKQILKI